MSVSDLISSCADLIGTLVSIKPMPGQRDNNRINTGSKKHI